MSELFRRFIFFMYIVVLEVPIFTILKPPVGHEPKPVLCIFPRSARCLRCTFYCHPSLCQSYKVLPPKSCINSSPIHPPRYIVASCTSRFTIQTTTFFICTLVMLLPNCPQHLLPSINYSPVVLLF